MLRPAGPRRSSRLPLALLPPLALSAAPADAQQKSAARPAAAAPPSAGLTLPREEPIRLGRMPALSPDGARLAFCYQGSLWTVPVGGGVANRLTAASGATDDTPRWSPDGKWLAFNSDRNGGRQVYLIPADGGPAQQVTFHSGGANVGDWFPDGRSLAVIAARETRRVGVYRLDVLTGRLSLIVSDDHEARHPSVSPDGKWVAYSRGAVPDVLRKGYRGAANWDIWVAPADGSAPPKRVSKTEGNESWPVWSGDGKALFFAAEPDGGRDATVFRQTVAGGAAKRVVTGNADAVRFLGVSRNGARLAFECDARLCVTPAEGGAATPVAIYCRTDERGPRESYVTYRNDHVSEYAVSPDGKRAVVVVRGDLFLVSTERPGEAKRLTDNPTRDQDIIWSPDGKRIVYVSQRGNESHLFAMDVSTRRTTQLTRVSGSVESGPQFSPDGKWVAFRRGPKTSLFLVRPDGTGETKVADGPKVGDYRWSRDSSWLAYEKEDDLRSTDLWAVRLSPGASPEAAPTAQKPLNVTDHPGRNYSPVWSPDGKRLFFLSNRYRDRDIQTINDQGRFSLYSLPLKREETKFDDLIDPEADETETPKENKDVDSPKETRPPDAPPSLPAPRPAEPKVAEVKPAAAPTAGPKKPGVTVDLDADEIERRARQVVSLEDSVGQPSVSPDGKTLVFLATVQGRRDLWAASSDGGQVRRVTNGLSPTGLEWAADGSRLYYIGPDGAVHYLGRDAFTPGASPATSAPTLAFTVRMTIDRLTDYQAIFDEAWKTLADRFYASDYNGLDWKAVGAKYRALLPSVTTRGDFDYVVRMMLGELNASHLGFGPPDPGPSAPPTGHLGVVPDRAYDGPGVRVASVVKRSPAARTESEIKPLEVILQVDGQDVRLDSSLDKALSDTVGRTVRLKVQGVDGKTTRTVRLRPIGGGEWGNLLYERWIDERREIVGKASNGRVAYLHVADMGDAARNRFERELFSLGQRADAVIVDVRDNNGGDTHDAILRILERNRHYFSMSPRLETPFGQPERAVTRPVVLMTNEFSLSDAEVLANGFKELKLGPVVGQPTMGWIIFTYNTRLLDGSSFRVPHLGCFTNDGRDMENWGVPPDIRIDNAPADVIAGRDPQLERAVAEAMKRAGKGPGVVASK